MCLCERTNCRFEGNGRSFNDSADEIQTLESEDVPIGLFFIFGTSWWSHHHFWLACHRGRGLDRLCLLQTATF